MYPLITRHSKALLSLCYKLYKDGIVHAHTAVKREKKNSKNIFATLPADMVE